ncbi:protein RIK isoform X2 [Prosopis cineraria]|uniref:protein RIK isoform X2 n=1 Tax=Prosopis cineraria TaxID=364024 RepID=UPI00240F1E5A|nr:protein RIK isoform X2 [Prosopis cineraria]
MTEDNIVRASSPKEASQSKQRKKRKWDQPAETLVTAGIAVPGVLSLGNGVPLTGMAFPGVTPLTNPLPANCATVPQVLQAPSVQLHAAAAVQKINQQKIQDELVIAREIVINDAESSIRYKLTKRQTQEEIQKCTGAVVITRGKYRLPNAPPDGEKPLYLHISSGAHLKETAERILAVDRAAAMIEEMLRQGQCLPPISHTANSPMANGAKVLSTCVFLGFDADPSLNIVARIRGPNDQYINHIMNETGATVVLRGRGSGNTEGPNGEDGQQPLHLYLSSNNAKSLDDAKSLAENLLDTISAECGTSRVSSCKVFSAVPPPQQVYSSVPPAQQVYGAAALSQQVPSIFSSPQQVYSAVPPPQQLLAGVQSSGSEIKASAGLAACLMSSTTLIPAPPASLGGVPAVTTTTALGTALQPAGFLSSGQPQSNVVGYTPPMVSGGTSYVGYGGIYPQATPLQQVALALRHTPPVASTVAPSTSASGRESKSITGSAPEKEKRPPQRRKFQELPVDSKGPSKLNQASEEVEDLALRNVSTMPPPKKLFKPLSNGMPPPPPRAMPPPPPPKFSASPDVEEPSKSKISNKTKSDAVPDTLIKLMEYGEDDDDPDDSSEESLGRSTPASGTQKPFWAS